jgi:osmotically-inducible protein OsmY
VLLSDPAVPPSVDVRVRDGLVTLTGLVDWEYQRDEAESVASGVPGIRDLENHIELNDTTHVAIDVGHDIRRAFVRNAKLDADKLTVATSNGTVFLSGTVHSRDEHDAAVAAAWSAPGVRVVEDRLTVTC